MATFAVIGAGLAGLVVSRKLARSLDVVLFEKSRGEGMILIVYNTIDIDTSYDRAVFFFDNNDVLTEYSSYIRPNNTDHDT